VGKGTEGRESQRRKKGGGSAQAQARGDEPSSAQLSSLTD
jgi:hypothetical protein